MLHGGEIIWIKHTLKVLKKNFRIAMWIENTSGESLQQFMEKTWSEDLITC